MNDIRRLNEYIRELNSLAVLTDGRLSVDTARDMLVASDCISSLLTGYLIKHNASQSCEEPGDGVTRRHGEKGGRRW